MGNPTITLERLRLIREWRDKQMNGQPYNGCPFERTEDDCKLCSLIFGYPLATIYSELWGQGLLDRVIGEAPYQYIASCPCNHGAIGLKAVIEIADALIIVMEDYLKTWDDEEDDNLRQKRLTAEALLAVGIVRFTSHTKGGGQHAGEIQGRSG